MLAVTGLVTNADGRVLLVRVAARDWELPGGQVEEGEDLLTALRRKIEEEAGCVVDVETLVGVYPRVSEPALLVLLFRCTHLHGDPRPQDADVAEAAWFTPDEARTLVAHPAGAERLADALSGREGVVYRSYRLDPYEVLSAQTL